MTFKEFSRRGFLKLGTATGAAVLTTSQWVYSAGSDVLRIGLVGCGRRGTGSLLDSLTAMPNVRVVALGDLFREKAVATRAAIAASDIGKGRIDVPDDRIFTGFDSYKGVIAESDVVHIALPSRFHPPSNLAAVQAGTPDLPFSSGHEQVEQDQTSTVQFHRAELARTAVDEPSGHRQPDRQHHDEHRLDCQSGPGYKPLRNPKQGQ